MSDDFLGDRRKALEDQFFEKQNRQLLDSLRDKREAGDRTSALAAASGIGDTAVLEKLVALEIGVDALAALSLIPLVAVAWADGVVQAREKEAVLQAAGAEGLKTDDVSYQLLESWLAQRPGPELVSVWKDYMGALSAHLDQGSRGALKNELLGRARTVAKAAGGFLGLGNKVSAEEARVLDELEAVFS
jgi:hypothetical protein